MLLFKTLCQCKFSFKVKFTLLTSYRLKVRTLSFHLKNVGSIPASLSLFNLNSQSMLKKSGDNLNSEIKISFSSVFNPECAHNLRIMSTSRSLSNSKHFKLRKVLVKQSYLLVYWLKFLSNQTSNLVFLPKKNSLHTTKTKSPMAQKTFSQEQYTFKLYRYTTKRVKLKDISSSNKATCLRETLLLLLAARRQSFFFGTSMLFISRMSLFINTNVGNQLLLN